MTQDHQDLQVHLGLKDSQVQVVHKVLKVHRVSLGQQVPQVRLELQVNQEFKVVLDLLELQGHREVQDNQET